MPTNPPTPADRLAAVKACHSEIIAYVPYNPEGETYIEPCGEHHCRWDDDALTTLLAADPPGATVDIVCKCGHGENEHCKPLEYCVPSSGLPDMCACRHWTPTTARVSYERALTEEERNR